MQNAQQMAYYLFELREAGEPTTESRKYEYTIAQLSYCEDDIRRLKAQYDQWEGMIHATSSLPRGSAHSSVS